jgi:sugar (pentulose or hexulose) kinase
MSIAIVDVGKSNVKLLVLDDNNGLLATRSRPNTVLTGPPYPHYDVHGLEAWLSESLASLPGREAIAAIVTTTHGAAAALLAGETFALPVLDYEYAGPDEEAQSYAAAADPYARSFTPTLPLGLVMGSQLWWQMRRFPQAFARVTTILQWPQFWAWWLSGVAACEVTPLGSHSGLWLPQERRFSDLAQRTGWAALFPPLRHAWDTLGVLRPEIARATGLDPACRVVCGVHDSNASFLAHRATRQPPFTVISTGTWTIVMAAGAPIARLDAARDMLANVDVFRDPVPTARFMGGREFAVVAGEAAAARPTLADAARVVARGSMALPSFVPEGGPFATRKGEVVGPPVETPAERSAMASLYLALVVDVMLDLLGALPPFIAEGPSAGDGVFLAALAEFRHPGEVVASKDGTGTSAGAAILATWERRAPRAASGRTVSPPGETLPGLADYRRRWREAVG